MNCPLTVRQRQIFNFVSTQIVERQRAPTRVEIARHFGFRSANAAEDHLRKLARRGVIEIDPHTARGIRLTGVPTPVNCSKCNSLTRLLLECRDALQDCSLADQINDVVNRR